MAEIMTPSHGKGAELRKLLCHELGIPENVRWFEVRFALDECVSVTCEYVAKDKEEVPVDGG